MINKKICGNWRIASCHIFYISDMNKYKLLSIPVFFLAFIVAISALRNIVKQLSEPSSPGPDPYYTIAGSIGYYVACALFLWLSYWLFKKGRHLWNKEV